MKSMSVPGVLVLANGKGGVGKSTLARALAAHWMQSGLKPALVDADPQGSIAQAHDPDGPMGTVPVREASDEKELPGVIREFMSEYKPVIVDTAGFKNRTAILALLHSDVAVIPLKPGKEDLREAFAIYGMIGEINETTDRKKLKGKPILPAFVLTMSIRGTVIARQIRNEMEKARLPLLESEMSHRIAYPEASINGLAPNLLQPEGAAAHDITAIAHEISNLIKG
jgi:chromosome partitioning protein